MADKVGTGYVPIKPDAEGFGADLERQIDKEAGPAAESAGRKMATKFAKGIALAGAAAIGKSVMDFAGFEQGMNEVFTLMPGITGDAMGKMTQQVKDFSTEFGVLPTETVPALYEALGAGIPPDNIFEFLETAQKLAKGGVTDLATSVDGLSSVVNAYGSDVISAGEASDIMFKIVGLGKGTLDDVAGSLFNVTPIASALGVSFEDVGAAMAVLSSKGTPVSVATTQIRSVLGELGKDGTKVADIFREKTGKSFQQFIADGGNLSNALHVIDDAAFESGLSVMDLFGSIEAGSAALSLLEGGGEAFSDAITQMEGAAGSTEAAYNQMNQGLSVTLERLRANFAVVMLNIGESIAPTIGVIGDAVGQLLELFSKLPGPMQAVLVLVTTIGAGLFAFAGPILKGIQLFKQLNGVFSLLAANPWILILIGLVTVTVLIIKNWDKVKAALGATWAALRGAAKATADYFTDAWSTATQLVEIAFGKLTGFFEQWWPYLLGVFTFGISAIVMLVVQNWDAIFAKVTGVATAIGTAVTDMWNAVWSTTQSIGGNVVGFIVAIPEKVTGAFVGLAGLISAPFIAAFGAIKSSWNATVGGFGFKTPDWIPGLGGKSFTIPSMAAGAVLTGAQLFMGGEYPGAGRNPEIVAPQSIMRTTMIEAIEQTGAAGGTGLIVNGPLIGEATIRDERDIVELSRELAREVERRSRGAGKRLGGVMPI